MKDRFRKIMFSTQAVGLLTVFLTGMLTTKSL